MAFAQGEFSREVFLDRNRPVEMQIEADIGNAEASGAQDSIDPVAAVQLGILWKGLAGHRLILLVQPIDHR